MAGMAPCGYYKARILRIELGDDADNVRVDTSRHRVLVGYGEGTLAIIDPVSRSKTADLRLNAHPDSFQIDETGSQVFVNVPDAGEIEIVDLAAEGDRSNPGAEQAMLNVESYERLARATVKPTCSADGSRKSSAANGTRNFS